MRSSQIAVIFLKSQVASNFMFANPNTNRDKSGKFALVGTQVVFFPRGSYIWLHRLQILFKGSIGIKTNFHAWLIEI